MKHTTDQVARDDLEQTIVGKDVARPKSIQMYNTGSGNGWSVHSEI